MMTAPNLRIKLNISDKVFISSTKVLCNKTNGNTLFIRGIMGINEDDEESKMNQGDDSQENIIKPQQAKDGNYEMELFYFLIVIHHIFI